MKLLTLHELLYLSDQNCEYPLEYDEHYLHCSACGKAWLYTNFKACQAAFETNPQEYFNNLTNDK